MKRSAIRFVAVSFLMVICLAAVLSVYSCIAKKVPHNSQREKSPKGEVETKENPQPSNEESKESDHNFFTPKPVSYSPYYIAKLINGNNRKWNKSSTNETIDLKPVWDDLQLTESAGDYADFLAKPDPSSKARIYKAELDEETGKEILLRIEFSMDYCRFLIFKPLKSPQQFETRRQWLLLGYIDHGFNRYEMA